MLLVDVTLLSVTVERRTGPTPAGGVRSEAFYCDENMAERDNREATHVIIRELDADGQLVSESFATVTTPTNRDRRPR